MTDVGNEYLFQQSFGSEPLASDNFPLNNEVPPSEYHKILNGPLGRNIESEKMTDEGARKEKSKSETDDRFVVLLLPRSFPFSRFPHQPSLLLPTSSPNHILLSTLTHTPLL